MYQSKDIKFVLTFFVVAVPFSLFLSSRLLKTLFFPDTREVLGTKL